MDDNHHVRHLVVVRLRRNGHFVGNILKNAYFDYKAFWEGSSS